MASGERSDAPRAPERARELERTWHREIPLTVAMGLGVERWTPRSLTIGAELGPNVNVHGTAFAGSLYSIAALAGWGLVHLELEHSGERGAIVIADARIRYLRPVGERIRAHARPADDAAFAAALARLASEGRTRLELAATIEAEGEPAVAFEGTYAVRRDPPQGRR